MSVWNKGHLTGQKPPLKPREVWSIRTRLQVSGAVRELALFNLAIDSKLRGCDLVAIKVGDIALSGNVRDRGVIVQRKTGRPVQFEITGQTKAAVKARIVERHLTERDYLFPSRVRSRLNMTTRQYSRIVDGWVASIGLDPKCYGVHSMRRTKASQIYKKTGNIRAVQLLLGRTKLESTVRYLGIEVDDAIAIVHHARQARDAVLVRALAPAAAAEAAALGSHREAAGLLATVLEGPGGETLVNRAALLVRLAVENYAVVEI